MKNALPLAVAAALALPAAAAAHPSVYADQTRSGKGADPAAFDGTRYIVANHGFSFVFLEDNGVTTGGVLDYSSLPNPWRGTLTWDELVAHGTQGVQAHATCDADALETESAIKGWQEGDPFYAYVPFQKDAVGIDDDPADWIGHVKALVGVDLATQDPQTACEGLGGTFVKADSVYRDARTFNAGLLEHETAPLKTAVTDAQAATSAVQALLDAARAELARMAAAAKPMTLALPSARAKARTVARQGATVQVSGPAGAAVRVELRIAESQARKLDLGSSRLAATRVTLAADGTATATLKPGKRARKALGRVKRPIAMTVTALSGDRIATSGGTLTR